MEKKTPSNISTIVQHAITKEQSTKFNSYLSKEKDSLEPSIDVEHVEYGKAIVHEYTNEDGVIHIIDNTDNKFRVIEILPNGTYTAKTTDQGTINKTNGNSLYIVNGNLTLKVNNGEINIIGDSITLNTGDASSWKPNIISVCPYTGQPHGGEAAGIIKLKGE